MGSGIGRELDSLAAGQVTLEALGLGVAEREFVELGLILGFSFYPGQRRKTLVGPGTGGAFRVGSGHHGMVSRVGGLIPGIRRPDWVRVGWLSAGWSTTRLLVPSGILSSDPPDGSGIGSLVPFFHQ